MAPMLHLLRQPRYLRPTGAAVELERKTAALLAVLAIDGSAGRVQLAGLLWPSAGDERARANLRQLLSRLRKIAGEELVSNGDPLRLAPAVRVDLQLEMLLAGVHGGLEADDRILAGVDYADCPELTDWLEAATERQRQKLLAALDVAADGQEAEGDLVGALGLAQRILALDTFSERSHRRLVRLHYLLGDRGAALRAYEACERLFAVELGVEPLPETRALALLVKRGERLPSTVQPAAAVPLGVLRPPQLVGRDREWDRMTEAWRAGRVLFVSGAPGVGKSRLARDFAAVQGPTIVVEYKSGDVAVPFSSYARATRQLHRACPDVELPDWVRHELSRLVPEMADATAHAPLESEFDRLRFHEAQVEFQRLIDPAGLTLVIDDLHFVDPGSITVGHFMVTNPPTGESASQLRLIFVMRSDALPEPLQQTVTKLVDDGLAEVIELQPLGAGDVESLVGQLDLPAVPPLHDAIARVAGGNPALILELARSWFERGASKETLLCPDKVAQVLRARLLQLSGPARHLAQVAAAAGEHLTVDLAADVVGCSPLELASSWRELEDAQILCERRLTHELLRDAALADVPEAIVGHLHRSIASFLEDRGGDPVSLALHRSAAGDERQAAPHQLLES